MPISTSPLSLAEEDEDDGTGEQSANDYFGVSPTPGGAGLSALNIPGAAEALALQAKSTADARAALQRAREQMVERRYSRALPLLAISSALGKPTRTGSIGETFGNVSEAISGPVREKQAFEQMKQKEMLGLDTQIAGLDQTQATTQLQLAALQARLANQAAIAPKEKVVENGVPIYRNRPEAVGKQAYVPPGAQTNVNVNTDKQFMGTLAEGTAKLYQEQYGAALKAPAELERNARILELLKTGAYTGMGANWKLGLDRALAAAGIDFGGDKIANTEQLGSELSAGTLALIKSSGLGGGTGFSNADRDFLTKVAGGEITINRETLERLAKLHARAQRNTIKTWNNTFGRISKHKGAAEQLAAMGLEPLELPADMDAPPPAQIAPGAPPEGLAPPAEAAAPPGAAAPVAAPNGLAPAQWSIDPGNPPPRASPAHEAALKANPDRAQEFVEKFGYLPQ